MLVSVVMNCLNGEAFLKRSMDSVFLQTYDIFEVVFIDNGSSDMSGEIAKQYGPKVSYYRNDKTTTLGEARDKGIMLANGNLIAFIDVDDAWEPNKIEEQVRLMKDEVSFVFSNAFVRAEDGANFNLFEYVQPTKHDISNSLLRTDFIATSSVLFRRDAYFNSGEKYNKELTIECDRDFFLRIVSKCNVDYFEGPLITRYMHSSSTTQVRTKSAESSITELKILQDTINIFCKKIAVFDVPSLEVFNSNINILKGRHYWSHGHIESAKKSFAISHTVIGKLLYVATYIYPFKCSLKFVILLRQRMKLLLCTIKSKKYDTYPYR